MTWLLMNWKLVLLGTALAAVLGLSIQLKIVTAELGAANATLLSISETSKAQKEASEFNAKVINDSIPIMVAQAQKNAISNFKAKYGNSACYLGSGVLPSGMLHTDNGNDQANSTKIPDGASTDSMADFVTDCSKTTVMLTQFQEWAKAEHLEVK